MKGFLMKEFLKKMNRVVGCELVMMMMKKDV
jgi:hypothetical protein